MSTIPATENKVKQRSTVSSIVNNDTTNPIKGAGTNDAAFNYADKIGDDAAFNTVQSGFKVKMQVEVQMRRKAKFWVN